MSTRNPLMNALIRGGERSQREVNCQRNKFSAILFYHRAIIYSIRRYISANLSYRRKKTFVLKMHPFVIQLLA